jgi:hypothetical protein
MLCSVCGKPDGRAYGLCGQCLRKHVREERREQGLPATVESVASLQRVATVITGGRRAA